jgi:ATP-dependent RNA helicase DDX49/DBP8
MELFSAKRNDDETIVEVVKKAPKKRVNEQQSVDTDPDAVTSGNEPAHMFAYSFKELGMCDWICQSTEAVGYKHPTDIQRACIPAILQGRDVLACAETGSGKTAAFVLPMMQILSQDPYGIFGLILTPTRELAIQIAEQIAALGSSLSVKVCLVIGGLNLTEQGLQLATRPHFVVATPGRLRHHLEASACPPNISKAKFLVLDEADRLLSLGFSTELEIILSKMSPRRQTLLFSATLTNTLEELEQLALKDALRFDLTKQRQIPSTLKQRYLFMPAKVKICFLYAVLNKYIEQNQVIKEDDVVVKKKTKNSRKETKEKDVSDAPLLNKSIIIFVESCHRCHEICEVLKALSIECVALHSMMPQSARLTSLAKFKSMNVKILIATDVASRGLDIPTVDLVLNFDLPRVCSDYVHRVGRTARAGRGGQSISFVTQYDIALLQTVEEHVGTKMTLYEDVSNDDIIPLLNLVSKAMQSVQLNMLESDFMDKEATFKKRKQVQRKNLLRKKGQAQKLLAEAK